MPICCLVFKMEYKAQGSVKIVIIVNSIFYKIGFSFIKGEIMIKLNKYLKEIGIDENYWLFKEDRQEDEDGFVYCEFFNLDTTMAMYIYSHLCYFREHCNIAFPGGLDEKQWNHILDSMIEAFKLQIVRDDTIDIKDEKERYYTSKNREKKIKFGMRMFIKYFGALWY